VAIVDANGVPKKFAGRDAEVRYVIPVGAQLLVNEGQDIHAGEIVAKIHRETSKTKDITGGLPRVAELFETRKPKEAAIISEIDGFVTFGKDVKGKQRVIVTPEVGEQSEYLIPKGKHVAVREGEYVKKGEPLMDGPTNPHDILKVLGEKVLAAYLVNEVQEVYRLQGVVINDKHIEVIVRQMMRKVMILQSGDTQFLAGEQVERYVLDEENDKVTKEGGRPATFEPLLLGITKVSLSTDSWISAASFQETTKVLTEAAINSKTDTLRGLKENIIMGRLIPAGTGLSAYKRWKVVVEDEETTGQAPGIVPRTTATQSVQ
jgi:DNA-directed RNA polymerase subunit beta'